MPALDAAAAGSGVTDLTTVRVLASNEIRTPLQESRTGAAIRPSEGLNAAQRATVEPGAQPPARPDAGTASETETDAKRQRASWRRGRNPRKTSRPDVRHRTTSPRRRHRFRRGPPPPVRARTTMARQSVIPGGCRVAAWSDDHEIILRQLRDFEALRHTGLGVDHYHVVGGLRVTGGAGVPWPKTWASNAAGLAPAPSGSQYTSLPYSMMVGPAGGGPL